MELNLYRSILTGVLKPWSEANQNVKFFSNNLTPSLINPKSPNAFHSELKRVLGKSHEVFEEESINLYLAQPSGKQSYTITKPVVSIVSPPPTNSKERFYFGLIENEATRISNNILQALLRNIEDHDRSFIINSSIITTKGLLRQIGEVKKAHVSLDTTSRNILTVLSKNVIRLLHEIELCYPQFLKTIPSDKILIFTELLNEEVPEGEHYTASSAIPEIHLILTKVKLNIEIKKALPKDSLSFGFKGDKEKLEMVLRLLEQQVEFFKPPTTIADAVSVFTSSNLTSASPKIYLGINTQGFRYIIDQIAPHFNNLKLTPIDKSKLFHSLRNPEKTITRENLSSSKSQLDVKNKSTIDNILKHLTK